MTVQAGKHGDSEDHQFWTRFAASTAARSILPPPDECTVSMLTPSLLLRPQPPRRCWGYRDTSDQEKRGARSYQIAHYLRTFGGVELHADFIGQRGVFHRRHNLLCGGGGGNIQGHDEPLARIIAAVARNYRLGCSAVLPASQPV